MSDDGLRFGRLGPLTVRAGGQVVRLAAEKPRQFLATLLLNPNRVTPLDTVVDILWRGRPPRSAIANIRTYASSLRTTLGGIDRIIGDSVGYRLRVSPHELDMLTFTELTRQAESALARHRPEIALELSDRGGHSRHVAGADPGRCGDGEGAEGRHRLSALPVRRRLPHHRPEHLREHAELHTLGLDGEEKSQEYDHGNEQICPQTISDIGERSIHGSISCV
nr:hypothetical protein [Nonomuraea diastatica]